MKGGIKYLCYCLLVVSPPKTTSADPSVMRGVGIVAATLLMQINSHDFSGNVLLTLIQRLFGNYDEDHQKQRYFNVALQEGPRGKNCQSINRQFAPNERETAYHVNDSYRCLTAIAHQTHMLVQQIQISAECL